MVFTSLSCHWWVPATSVMLDGEDAIHLHAVNFTTDVGSPVLYFPYNRTLWVQAMITHPYSYMDEVHVFSVEWELLYPRNS